jgi:O-antigen/teichoic acid export membrane protein
MALGQATSFALQFAASVVLARFLSPYQMGIYAVAASTVGLLSIVQAFGLQNLIVRQVQLTSAIRAAAFTINGILAIALSGCIAAASVFSGAFLHDPGVRKVLLALSVIPLLGIFEFLPSANLERRGEFKSLSLIGTTSGAAATAVTIVLAFLDFNYMSVPYGGWAGAIVRVIFLNVVGRADVSFRVGFRAWRHVASFGVQMLLVAGISSTSQRLAELTLARVLGLGALGIYNRASSLNGLLWNNIHLVVGRVVFVEFAELNRRGISLRDRYLRTVEIATAVLWPAFAGCAVISGPFILRVYGSKWLSAWLPFSLLAIASIVQVSITMTWELFAATGNLSAQTKIEFVRAIVALLTFVAGCAISLTAAASARVIDAVFAFFLYRPHLDRMTNTSLSDFVPIYGRSALLTILAIAPSLVLMIVFHMSASAPLSLVLASLCVGLLFWLLGAVLLKHPLVQEFKATVHRIRDIASREASQPDAEIHAEASVLNAAERTRDLP